MKIGALIAFIIASFILIPVCSIANDREQVRSEQVALRVTNTDVDYDQIRQDLDEIKREIRFINQILDNEFNYDIDLHPLVELILTIIGVAFIGLTIYALLK